jgi:N-acetylglucosaminyldiphosphoundecaprenol N-acetyl-beta-D-mannosaminyltransferase
MTSYIADVKIYFGHTFDTVLTLVEGFLTDGKKHYICTTNPEFIMTAQKDPEFRDIINNSDLSLPDGAGTIFAQRYTESVLRLPKDVLFPFRAFVMGILTGVKGYGVYDSRIDGVGLVERICELSSKKGNSKVDAAVKAKEKLMQKYPTLKITGATSEFKSLTDEDGMTIDAINSAGETDFLLVAYGHPNQEKWISRNKDRINAKVFIGVGGTLDYISDYKTRGPKFVQKINMEWLYRLMTQPKRIKRIVSAFPLFPLFIYYKSLSVK